MYNYVFFWGQEDYYKYVFANILSKKNVRYISEIPYFRCKIIKKIHRIHQSSKINKYINLPFRKLWINSYFKNDFSDNKPIIFIFHGSYYWLRSMDYFQYLHKKYPGCKCILLLMDTVGSYIKYFNGKYYGDFDVNYLKLEFDYVLSYNKLDAVKYHFIYYPAIYSMTALKKKNCSCDVFFVGRAKDRLEKIIDVYEKLTRKGLICDFYITGVPKVQQRYRNKIHYNEMLSYREVLNHINKAKAILEIVQGGSNGFTLRMNEAFAYDKNLITNNPIVLETQYKDSLKIFHIDALDKLEVERFQKSCNMSYKYGGEYSPVRLLDFLANLICGEGQK